MKEIYLDLATRNAKKWQLLNRACGKRSREAYVAAFDEDVSYLDLESSLSLRRELSKRHILAPNAANKYKPYEVSQDLVGESLDGLGSRITGLEPRNGFCFLYEWDSTGVAIMGSHLLGSKLSELM